MCKDHEPADDQRTGRLTLRPSRQVALDHHLIDAVRAGVVHPRADDAGPERVGDRQVGAEVEDLQLLRPGTGDDFLDHGNAARTFSRLNLSAVSGTYTPVVGDFDGDSKDGIFWHQAADSSLSAWGGNAIRNFAQTTENVPGSDLFATLEWMRTSLPHAVDAYDPRLLGPPPFPESLSRASSVLAPWSLGHLLLYEAELPVVANNFGYGFLDSISFCRSSSICSRPRSKSASVVRPMMSRSAVCAAQLTACA